jgi:tetratricopeptide (TPR) repeat protein
MSEEGRNMGQADSKPEQFPDIPAIKTRLKIAFKIVAIVAAVTILLPPLTVGVLYGWVEVKYRIALKHTKALGLPTTMAEVMPPEIPPGQNAAEDFRVAFKVIDAVDKKLLSIPDAPDAWGFQPHAYYREFVRFLTDGQNKDVVDAVLPYLPEYDDTLKLIAKACNKPRLRFEEAWVIRDDPPDTFFSPAQAATRLLVMNAVVAARQGKLQDALQYLITAIAMEDLLRDEPILSTLWLRGESRAEIFDATSEMFKTKVPEETLIRLADALKTPSDQGDLEKAIRTSVPYFLELFQRLIAGEMKQYERDARHFLKDHWIQYDLVKRYNRAFYLAQVVQVIRDLKFPLKTGQTVSHNSYLYTAYDILWDLYQSSGFWAQACAKRDLVKLALAIRRYELRYKRFPEKLGQLVTEQLLIEVPSDPVSGKAYRYSMSEDSATVYTDVKEEVVDVQWYEKDVFITLKPIK